MGVVEETIESQLDLEQEYVEEYMKIDRQRLMDMSYSYDPFDSPDLFLRGERLA